jgi:hypothetical protein
MFHQAPLSPSNSERIRSSHDQIVALTQAHCDLIRERLGDAGFAEYFALNRRWLSEMQTGGVIQMDYSQN